MCAPCRELNVTPTFCKTIVAIYHNSASIIKRSAGKSSIAAAAYRSGNKLTDNRTGLTHDYSRKSGVDKSIILTPIAADWITDRAKLWNKIEEVEKRDDAQLSREVTLAIPIELNRDDKIDLVYEYVQKNFVDLGMIADINFHGLDSDNPHAHIMLSLRDLKIDEQGVVNFGNKNRGWNHKNLLIKNREDWATLTNEYLIEAGYPDIQIDHRSNADRKIEAIPQIHLGAAVAGMRKKGIATERSGEYDRIEIANNNIRQKLEQIYESESITCDLERQLAKFDRQVSKREQFYEKKPTEVAKPPKPAYIKWSLKREIDPQLVRSILETADRLGTKCYTADNYHVQILRDEIEVRYQNNRVMIIDISTCHALLTDRSFTLKQYEIGLARSIDILLTEPEQQREQQRQAEPEQLEQLEQQKEPELQLPHDIIDDFEIIVDDSELTVINDTKIDLTKLVVTPLINKNLSRSEWHR
jgi:hypothetical protein